MNELIMCPKCKGTGKVEEGAIFTGSSSVCKGCGFTALGQTQVRQFEKRGNYCRTCSGDYS